MKAAPLESFKKIFICWGMNIPDWCIEEALKRSSKKEMKKKMDEMQLENNLAVSYRGKKMRGIISESRKRFIIDYLDANLVHYLGYEYNYDTEYGFEYE